MKYLVKFDIVIMSWLDGELQQEPCDEIINETVIININSLISRQHTKELSESYRKTIVDKLNKFIQEYYPPEEYYGDQIKLDEDSIIIRPEII